jgi:hypothetical protein
MVKRQNWVDHVFNLGVDIGWQNNILTRVRDSSIRIAHHTEHLTENQLTLKIDGKWSIKEHIGHLIDLEIVHHLRLIEFKNFAPRLTGADMKNVKTETANHNDIKIETLISKFELERQALIQEFNSLSMESKHHISIHPRLKVEMKPVDMMFFVAEHDDHHLASIFEIKNSF